MAPSHDRHFRRAVSFRDPALRHQAEDDGASVASKHHDHGRGALARRARELKQAVPNARLHVNYGQTVVPAPHLPRPGRDLRARRLVRSRCPGSRSRSWVTRCARSAARHRGREAARGGPNARDAREHFGRGSARTAPHGRSRTARRGRLPVPRGPQLGDDQGRRRADFPARSRRSAGRAPRAD